MIRVKNTHNKRISFILDKYGHFAIDSGQKMYVVQELGELILQNKWIEEVKPEEKIENSNAKRKGRIKKQN